MKALQSCFNAYFVQKIEYGHHILESAAEIVSILSRILQYNIGADFLTIFVLNIPKTFSNIAIFP